LSGDPAKAATNRRKHGLAFDEASTVFSDALASTFTHADGTPARVIHIISARRATRRERKAYEEAP